MLRVFAGPRSGIALPPVLTGRSEHLAQPLELFREEGEAIVARELAFGPSLEDLLVLGPQPPLVVSALLRQMLDGLAALHAEGRTHLRLSPAAVRFDLLAGVLKITDLEEALVEDRPPDDLFPRYLEPEVRGGSGRPVNDVYSVGRIGEALLRGGAPLGPWGGTGAAPGPLWDFVQRCQSASLAERPVDAAIALAELERLGLPQAPALTLPIGGFVRRHVRALRELRRWRAQPFPPLGATPDRGYRELLSSSDASRLWGAIGFAALLFTAATVAVAQAPHRSVESAAGIPADSCEPEARPRELSAGAQAPAGEIGFQLQIAEGQTLAIDGCPVRGEPGRPAPLAVSRGVHEFRVAMSSGSVAESLEVDEDQRIALDTSRDVFAGSGDTVRALVRRLREGAAPSEDRRPLDPLETGLLDPISAELLGTVDAVLSDGPQPSAALPLNLGLTVDALRSARRRFAAAAAPCAATLATAAARELGAGTEDSERALQVAVELLTVTRIRGAELREPLRTEKRGLEQLQIAPSRRVLSAVDQLAGRGDIARCLADLAPKVRTLNELSALAIGQLPGIRLPDDPRDDDSQQ